MKKRRTAACSGSQSTASERRCNAKAGRQAAAQSGLASGSNMLIGNERAVCEAVREGD